MVLYYIHCAVGLRVQVVGHCHDLDSDLCGDIEFLLEFSHSVHVGEIDVETAVLEFLIPFDSGFIRRNTVPGHDRQFLLGSLVPAKAGQQAKCHGSECR